jgi:hypothetical protein
MALLFIDRTRNFSETDLVKDPQAYLCECGKHHPRVWVIERVLCGQSGHFTVFRVNGAEHVWDASLPETLDKLPRDAGELPADLLAKMWHCKCGSHVFGCCYLQEARQYVRPRSGASRRKRYDPYARR